MLGEAFELSQPVREMGALGTDAIDADPLGDELAIEAFVVFVEKRWGQTLTLDNWSGVGAAVGSNIDIGQLERRGGGPSAGFVRVLV